MISLTLNTLQLVEEILANKPSIMFLHLDEVDIVGHKTFWGSEEYYDAAEVSVNPSLEIACAVSPDPLCVAACGSCSIILGHRVHYETMFSTCNVFTDMQRIFTVYMMGDVGTRKLEGRVNKAMVLTFESFAPWSTVASVTY